MAPFHSLRREARVSSVGVLIGVAVFCALAMGPLLGNAAGSHHGDGVAGAAPAPVAPAAPFLAAPSAPPVQPAAPAPPTPAVQPAPPSAVPPAPAGAPVPPAPAPAPEAPTPEASTPAPTPEQPLSEQPVPPAGTPPGDPAPEEPPPAESASQEPAPDEPAASNEPASDEPAVSDEPAPAPESKQTPPEEPASDEPAPKEPPSEAPASSEDPIPLDAPDEPPAPDEPAPEGKPDPPDEPITPEEPTAEEATARAEPRGPEDPDSWWEDADSWWEDPDSWWEDPDSWWEDPDSWWEDPDSSWEDPDSWWEEPDSSWGEPDSWRIDLLSGAPGDVPGYARWPTGAWGAGGGGAKGLSTIGASLTTLVPQAAPVSVESGGPPSGDETPEAIQLAPPPSSSQPGGAQVFAIEEESATPAGSGRKTLAFVDAAGDGVGGSPFAAEPPTLGGVAGGIAPGAVGSIIAAAVGVLGGTDGSGPGDTGSAGPGGAAGGPGPAGTGGGEGAGRADETAPLDATGLAALASQFADNTFSDLLIGIPDWVWVLLAILGGLALLLGLGYLLATLRARSLARQRRELLQEVGLLQSALLPPVPDKLGGLRTSVAYRPADGPGAGGDFYDVLPLTDGSVGFILGDVSGHGRGALARTAFMRYTLRAYLEAGLEPRVALQVAGRVIDENLGGDFATVLLAVHDSETGALTYATAGHPAPIVIGPQPHHPVTTGSSPPIGVGVKTGLRQTTVPLVPGSVAVLFTDGLMEARVEGGILGRERLEKLLGQLGPDASARTLIERVADEAGSLSDDIAAVVISPTVAATTPMLATEQLELSRAELEGPIAGRFLESCGVPEAEARAAVEDAQVLGERFRGAILRVVYGSPIRVEVFPSNMETIEAASRRAAAG